MQDIIHPGITHLMTWFGGALPEYREVHYRSDQNPQYKAYKDDKNKRMYVNYVETLKGECKKMEQKGEACILVYDGRMIKAHEEEKLKNIVDNINNCYLVNYEDFVKEVEKNLQKHQSKEITCRLKYSNTIIKDNSKNIQSWFIKHITSLIDQNSKTPHFTKSNPIDGMGNLIDCIRMLLLLNPSILKQIAIDKNKENKKTIKLKPDDFSLLYHDFDIIQKDKQEKDNCYITNIPKDYHFVLCKPMENADNKVEIENCIIRAISPQNFNLNILSTILAYKYGVDKYRQHSINNMFVSTKTYSDYHGYDFNKSFIDEGHRTWHIEPNRTWHIEPKFIYKKPILHVKPLKATKARNLNIDKSINNNISRYNEKKHINDNVEEKK